MNYYIIIPAHNEEAYLKLTLDSVVNQTLLPKKVVVVNDHSTDTTENIINAFASEYPYIQKVNTTSSTEHMPGSKVINAFHKGLEVLDTNYDFIVKLDADLILPEHYFESIANIFKADTKVGLAGGFAYEENGSGEWKLNHPMNPDHVRGAFKAYTKDCFTAIGGLKNSIGWDTVDELLVRFHGFKVYTDKTLQVKHLRPVGTSYNKKARLLQGEAMYKMRYGFLLTCLAAAKMAWKQRKFNSFFYHLKGYFLAKKKQLPHLVNPEEGKFIRNYRFKGILKKFG